MNGAARWMKGQRVIHYGNERITGEDKTLQRPLLECEHCFAILKKTQTFSLRTKHLYETRVKSFLWDFYYFPLVPDFLLSYLSNSSCPSSQVYCLDLNWTWIIQSHHNWSCFPCRLPPAFQSAATIWPITVGHSSWFASVGHVMSAAYWIISKAVDVRVKLFLRRQKFTREKRS